jgi:hypothetical protein
MTKLLFLQILALLFTANAYADSGKGCGSNDMNGVWTSYQGAVVVNPHTGVCDFTVANGQAQGNCVFSTGFKGDFQGDVVVNKDCSATFDMDFSPVAPVVANFQIHLHKDKNSFVGRFQNNFGVMGVTNAVKH